MFRRRFLRQLVSLLALLPIAGPLLAAPKNDKTAPPAAAPGESRTGTLQVTWNLPDKAALPKIVAALFDRFGWTIPEDSRGNLVQTLKEFDTRQNGSDGGEKLPADRPKPPVKVAANDDPPLYTVYVPASYKPGRSYGLFVWICAEDNPVVPEGWAEILDAHHFIWVAPHNVGNDTGNYWRSYMIFEAARNARQAFTIDEDRIYVGGFAEGARIASQVGQVYPDIFKGAFCCGGAMFYKKYSGPKGDVGGFWSNPNSAWLDLDRKVSRFVLVDVAQNSSFKNTRCVQAAMEADGFRSAIFLEAPTAKHWAPPGEDFDKGVVALDAPLTAAAERQYKEAQAAEKSRHFGIALNDYSNAAIRGGTQPFVADAQAKADGLKQQFEVQFAAIEQLIADKQFDKAVAAARDMQDKWSPYFAKDKFQALMRQISDARAGKH